MSCGSRVSRYGFALLLASLSLGTQATSAEDSSRVHHHFLFDSPQFNKSRFYGVTGGIAGGTGLSLILLNQYWYANYPRSAFHFFDDSREWLQFDKASHAFTTYHLSLGASELYQWAGVKRRTAQLGGALTGSALLLTIEVLDGFSSKWGASASDLGANLFGAGFFLGQELLFDDQLIRMKVSSFPQCYDQFDADVQERTKELYGSSFMERLIKDYNASTLWMSFNVRGMTGWNAWPRWLNVAVGYGVQNLFGGFENRWCDDPLISPENCPPAMLIDYSAIPRYRQWYISPDIDFTKLVTRKPVLRLVLSVLNIVKFPAPAIEYNGHEGLRFHFVHF